MLEKVLTAGPSRRFLDLGCGTGEHCRFLADQGFEVVGVDASASMIASARQEPIHSGVSYVEGDLRQIETIVEGRFGGGICLGNTLPHILHDDDLHQMLTGLRGLMLPRSPLLIQLLNYERIFERGIRYLPLNFRADGEEEIVFLRLMELRDDGQVLFFPSTLKVVPGGDPPLVVQAAKEVRLRGWRFVELEEAMGSVGFSDIQRFGDFQSGSFDPLESNDLILIAR